jgi:hypothetical protein
MSHHDRIAGLWHNEQGSEVTLEATADGLLRGRFASGVGFATEEVFPVTGFVSGDLVAFAVNFGKVGSITSWVGHLVESEGPALRTLWQMTVETPHPRRGADELWKTVWTGSNTFRRGPALRGRREGRDAPPLPLWLA